MISRNSIKFFFPSSSFGSFVVFVYTFTKEREREKFLYKFSNTHTGTHTQLINNNNTQSTRPPPLLNYFFFFGPPVLPRVGRIPVDLLVLIWHTEWSVFYHRKLISNTSQHISTHLHSHDWLFTTTNDTFYYIFFFKLFIKLYDIYIYIRLQYSLIKQGTLVKSFY